MILVDVDHVIFILDQPPCMSHTLYFLSCFSQHSKKNGTVQSYNIIYFDIYYYFCQSVYNVSKFRLVTSPLLLVFKLY